MTLRNPATQGIIFDMDGVLCNSERFMCDAACRMFQQRYGLRVKAEDFIPFVGAGEDRYLGGVAEKYGLRLAMPADKVFAYQIYLDLIRGQLHPLPGANEFVARCRGLGLKLAVASSADKMKVDGNLREIGIAPETFDAVVCGDDVARKKPDPEIFVLAARRIGLQPERCIVVEDAPNGIQAAKAAGSRCLALTTSFDAGMLLGLGADWAAPDLAHVPAEMV